jgi:hypothetical protein
MLNVGRSDEGVSKNEGEKRNFSKELAVNTLNKNVKI